MTQQFIAEKMSGIRYSLIVVLLLMAQLCFAGNLVKKGLTEVNKGNYSKAKPILFKALSATPDDYAVHYVIALYFSRGDNKDQKLDSAYYYIHQAIALYPEDANTTQMEQYAGMGIRPYTMRLLLRQVNYQAYSVADSVNTADAWDYFIKHFPKSKQAQAAVNRRNDLAFEAIKASDDFKSFKEFMEKYPNASQIPEAKQLYESLLFKQQTKENTSEAYKAFMENYPESPYVNQAKEAYELTLFNEATVDGRLESFYKFTRDHPDSPFKRKAEDRVYELYTAGETIAEYSSFVREFPDNHNAKYAWQILYEMYNISREPKVLQQFKTVYPDFPDKELLMTDLALSKKALALFDKNELFGYVDTLTGDTVIPAIYTDAYPFSEGLAAITTDDCHEVCRYGYIDKAGKLVIPVEYSEATVFKDGLAMVAKGDCYEDECKWGFINRVGRKVIPLEFDEAMDFSEGYTLLYIEEEGYGFLDKKGRIRISLQYEDAKSFSEGLAAISSDGLWGYIDTRGDEEIPYQFKDAGAFSEGLAPVADPDTGLWGFIDKFGRYVIEPQYFYANSFEDGFATVIILEDKNGIKIKDERVINRKGKFVPISE